ncbi:MAG: leucyl/phenylalanyl-tRNA--protein transferase [Proteobacteria bacterium]|nr:leucyl/phenylalanyl-tRNA--protein transferase [Pseudomonadota bacterium]MDA0927378.1 leucyl/phenylalanyl-tRNA--protein transferase [Pseudomonadota bacterium]
MPLPWLDSEQPWFPPLDEALDEPNGLLAAGGDLSPDWLLAAYAYGVFPWYEAGQPILWWSPDPRLVLYPDQVRVSRSLKKFLRKHPYRLSMDTNFSAVIESCGKSRAGSTGTWITDEMRSAYQLLHQLGHAHSVEVWADSALVGGLYGVSLGKVFFGESMFSVEPNTSKLALVALARHLEQWGFRLIDCQVASKHLLSLGAQSVDREQFANWVNAFSGLDDSNHQWQIDPAIQLVIDEIE